MIIYVAKIVKQTWIEKRTDEHEVTTFIVEEEQKTVYYVNDKDLAKKFHEFRKDWPEEWRVRTFDWSYDTDFKIDKYGNKYRFLATLTEEVAM